MKKSQDQLIAYLGKHTDFEGKLKFHGTIRVDDHFKGEISSDGTLIVGEEAVIEADVHVSSIIISGEVHGNIIADEKIAIFKPGKVFGDIESPTVVMDAGAIFEGKTQMNQDKPANEPEFTVLDQDTEEPGQKSLGKIFGIVKGSVTPSIDGEKNIFVAAEEGEQGVPIKNAKVIATCKGKSKRNTRTDASGRYELPDLEDGLWKLKVKAKGYEEGEATVEISGGGTYEQDFV